MAADNRWQIGASVYRDIGASEEQTLPLNTLIELICTNWFGVQITGVPDTRRFCA
jgi:hypothetical protein